MEVESESPLSPSESRSKKRGGWRAIKYILGNESFEKLASMSLVANITVYLRTKYNLSGILLVNVVTLWSGTSNISTIAGAIISDAYIGRYLTLLFGTIFSLLGMAAVTLTAGIDELRPPQCQDDTNCIEPQKWQLGFLFSALGLIAIGAGGIRPCNIAFGADQFDTNTEKGRAGLESFFNWWYFSFTIALVIALTCVIYVQTNVSWVVGFAIPTSCLMLSIAIFLIGRHTYIYVKPQGTVFLDMAKVLVAAIRKRRVSLKTGEERSYYHGPTDESARDALVRLVDGEEKRFKWLDKAAVIVDGSSELDSRGLAKDNWRLCSVKQVENLKCLVRILPVWLSGIGCFVVMDQQSTFGVLQAIQTNRTVLGNFQVPPGWMGITSMVSLSIWILIYEQMYLRNAKKCFGGNKQARLSVKQRIVIGILASIACMLVAGTVEGRRRALASGRFVSSMHVSALLPQFVLSGLTEAFAAVALMEFFTVQMPEALRSVAGSVFFLSLSVASYASSFMVNVMHGLTSRNGSAPWLGGADLNKNRLDKYYYMVAVLGSVNLLYFGLVAHKYIPKVVPEELERTAREKQEANNERKGEENGV